MNYTLRDDDISKDTGIDLLKFIHNQFLTHHRTHTVALICKDLELNTSLVNYINKTHNWDLCIHGWDHINYSLASKDQIAEDLDKCILKIEELFGVVPEKWYLPWNGWSPEKGFDLIPRVADIALYHGVDVDNDCDHISHFVASAKDGVRPSTSTIYFHSWDTEDLKLLPSLFYLTEKKIKHSSSLQELL